MDRNLEKDVDGATSATVIGVDVTDGLYLGAAADKVAALIAGTLDWLGPAPLLPADCDLAGPKISPHELMTWLGLPHWFCQLSRPLYSVLQEVYRFVEDPSSHCQRPLGQTALAEVLAILVLVPYSEADLTRAWAPTL